jgi:hypothetical protein
MANTSKKDAGLHGHNDMADGQSFNEHYGIARVWESQHNLPWRTEESIPGERQHQLTEWRSVVPDWEKGIYPFRWSADDVVDKTLYRDDIEWLLATHTTPDDVRGPVELGDNKMYPRKGLDLRGARIRKKDHATGTTMIDPVTNEEVGADLHSLPLTRLRGGLTWYERDYLERPDCALKQAEKDALCQAAAIDLTGADLHQTHLEGAYLFGANLENADLSGAYFNHLSDLTGVKLGKPRLLNLRWGNANLSVVDWMKVDQLGEGRDACAWTKKQKEKPRSHDANVVPADKDDNHGVALYLKAVRANRQLATALQQQGLSEEAARFMYGAQVLQRQVLKLRARQAHGRERVRYWLSYLFSRFLDLLAGYGYKPRRTALAYVSTILLFWFAYGLIGHLTAPHVSTLGALEMSITAFHGRGFFPGPPAFTGDLLDAWLIRLSAVEAVIGLFIEISFIATFTQRYFSR